MRFKKQQLQPGMRKAFKNAFLILEKSGHVVAQKWPKKRGPAKSGPEWTKQQTFGMVAKYTKLSLPQQQQEAKNMIQKSSMVWRDAMMSAAYGNLFEIEDTDGNLWKGYRLMAGNIQNMLDTICNTPGAMLRRSDTAWTFVPPGEDGLALVMEDGVPTWSVPIAANGGFATTTMLGTNQVNDVGSRNTHGAYFYINAGTLIHGAGFTHNLGGTNQVLLSIAEIATPSSSPTAITEIVKTGTSTQYHATQNSPSQVLYAEPYVVTTSGYYALLFSFPNRAGNANTPIQRFLNPIRRPAINGQMAGHEMYAAVATPAAATNLTLGNWPSRYDIEVYWS